MRIYVASSWRNQFQPFVVRDLRKDGHEVYDFRNPSPGNHGFAWSEVDADWQKWPSDVSRYLAGLEHPTAVSGFRYDMDALRNCEACVMVMPCGPSSSMEMGWACGAGKIVCVYAPEIREPELMVKMAGLVTDDFEKIRSLLKYEFVRV